MVSVPLLLYAVLSTSILTVRGEVSAGLHAHRAAEGAGAPTGAPIIPGAGAGAVPRKVPGDRVILGAGLPAGAVYGLALEPARLIFLLLADHQEYLLSLLSSILWSQQCDKDT